MRATTSESISAAEPEEEPAAVDDERGGVCQDEHPAELERRPSDALPAPPVSRTTMAFVLMHIIA